MKTQEADLCNFCCLQDRRIATEYLPSMSCEWLSAVRRTCYYVGLLMKGVDHERGVFSGVQSIYEGNEGSR
jgi:hypothetical protein